MPTIEEMVETFCAEGQQEADVLVFKGLLAVIEKHVGPMVRDAFVAGGRVKDRASHRAILADDYAARIVAQLKGPTP